MSGSKWVAAAATAAMLCGCEMKLGGGAEDREANASATAPAASAEGKAEDGKFAIKAPGLDLSVDLPKGMTDRAKVDDEGKLLYPGSTISGLYVAGGGSGQGGEVELRFNSADPPGRIAAWYKDPARAGDFKLEGSVEEGSVHRLSGREAGGKQDFKLSLTPKGGGTDGRLTLRDRG